MSLRLLDIAHQRLQKNHSVALVDLSWRVTNLILINLLDSNKKFPLVSVATTGQERCRRKPDIKPQSTGGWVYPKGLWRAFAQKLVETSEVVHFHDKHLKTKSATTTPQFQVSQPFPGALLAWDLGVASLQVSWRLQKVRSYRQAPVGCCFVPPESLTNASS